MVALRSRRLEALLGGRLGDLEYGDVCSLVANQVAERFDLDFKGELYGQGDSEKRKLASDVAALANTAGGLLILGIAEDGQARAASAPDVVITDEEMRRIRQAVASNVAPLPVLDIVPVENPSQPDPGFFLIAVPRSLSAPHAVIVNDGFRFPRRNGTTTRYLTEPELADAYRYRFAGANRQVERAEQIESEAVARLAPGERCWLVVSLVPDIPGDMTIDQSLRARFRQETVEKAATIAPQGWFWSRVRVGRRRLLADGAMDNGPLARNLSEELHDDGAGTFAVQIPDPRTMRQHAPDTDKYMGVDDQHIVNGVLSGLSLLAHHAQERAAAGGTALVRAQLRPSDWNRPLLLITGLGFGDRLGDTTVSEPQTPAERVAPLDALATAGPELVSTAYLLATDLFQSFGWAEATQLTRDGQIRRPHWYHEWLPHLESWAAQAGVAISDEPVRS